MDFDKISEEEIMADMGRYWSSRTDETVNSPRCEPESGTLVSLVPELRSFLNAVCQRDNPHHVTC